MDAGNILKPRLARGDLHLVGATTLKEYRRIEKDPALERRFQPVTVGEPSIEDAVLILVGPPRRPTRSTTASSYTDEAIRCRRRAVRPLRLRPVPARQGHRPDRPGRRAAAPVARQAGRREPLCWAASRPSRRRRTRPSRPSTTRRRRGSATRSSRCSVELDDVSTPPARRGGRRRAGDRGDHLARDRHPGDPRSARPTARASRTLESELHERVIGQDDAVVAVAKAVRRNRTGLGDERRPVGSFLFLGPTGVGKTELAKALASSLFGDEKAMLRFDMSEFGERHTVARLVGAPPGYVGYDEAGQLTERVRRNPYSVVLLRRDREGAPGRLQPAAAGARRRPPDRRPGPHGRLPQHGRHHDLEPRFGVPRVAQRRPRLRAGGRIRGRRAASPRRRTCATASWASSVRRCGPSSSTASTRSCCSASSTPEQLRDIVRLLLTATAARLAAARHRLRRRPMRRSSGSPRTATSPSTAPARSAG